MAIHSFLKAEKGDPDWQFTPEDYIGKEFKIIDANVVDVDKEQEDRVILRQIPTERNLLAKHLKIFVHANSNLDLIILNDVDPKIQQVFLYNIHLETNSTLSLGMFANNGKFNKHIVQVYLNDFSSFTSYGFISNTCKGDTEIITKVIHNGVNSKNNQLFLSMAGKDSQTVYQSINIVENNAEDNEINLDSSGLIIGDNGRCHSKAENYIDANYTETAQRLITNTISLEKIAYLQSKGIPENKAKKLIIEGFKKIVFNIVDHDTLQEEIAKMYSES